MKKNTLVSQATFWQFFRLIFVVFSLYLLGDAFYRWDGFRYYASFSEFMPNVALAAILWSIAALITTVILWLILKVIERASILTGIILKMEYLFFNLSFFVILGLTALGIKRFIWLNMATSLQIKLVIFISILCISVFLTWLFHEKLVKWFNVLHARITPLVWIFSVFVIVSIVIVAYQFRGTVDDTGLKKVVQASSSKIIDRPNIILVTFDSLTARDMSLYGYHRKTTPFIDEWAGKATVFKRLEASDNYTAPTTASLMTGKRVWTHRRFQSEGTAPFKSKTENLPLLLKNNGYHNMAFITNELASVERLKISESFVVNPSFSDFMSPGSLYGFLRKYLYKFFGDKISLYYWILKEDFILHDITPYDYFKFPYKSEFPVKAAFDMFLTEINNNPRKPHFTWIHLFPPHAPYLSPEGYYGFFDSSKRFKKWKDQFKLIQPRYFSQEQQSDADILRARYDEFIRYCDKEFENFIQQLEKKGQLNKTVIILSADHGESFEHGFFTHGGPFLFEQMTHIPLIIKEPGQTEGRIIDTLAEQIDIPATILDLADIPVPPWMEGISLLPLMQEDNLPSKPVFSMNLEKNPTNEEITTGTIAVWEGDYKLIHSLDEKSSLLFNLEKDPDELNNLINSEPEIAVHLLKVIKENLKNANEKIIQSKRAGD